MLRSLSWSAALWIVAGLGGDLPTPSANDDLQTIVFVQGKLSQATQPVEVPVDRSVTSLQVSVLFPPAAVATLVRPGGATVKASDLDVTIQGVEAVPIRNTIGADGRHFSIASPEAGVWRVALAASTASRTSTFAVLAEGQSPTEFKSFRFVRKEGMNLHGPYFTLDGFPLVGTPEFGQAIVTPDLVKAVVRAVDATGATLLTLPLRGGEDRLPPEWLVGAIEANTDVGQARVVSPRVLSIEPGATAEALILVTIPASIPEGRSITLRVGASDTANESVLNYAELELEVARKGKHAPGN